MKVKVIFEAELTLSGDTIDEIREKWTDIPLFSEEAMKCGAEYIGLVLTERVDDGSYKSVDL